MQNQNKHQVGLLYDPAVLLHQPPEGHPERPARVQAVVESLQKTGLWQRATHFPVSPATRTQLERVHDARYLDTVEEVVRSGGGLLDAGDTVASPGSWAALLAASGAAIGAVDAVMTGQAEAAFAIIRPPGHHAPPNRAMGFCIVNHASVAAAHAIAEHGLSRILLVDFDVHHGNGTQDAFYGSPNVLYFSVHQSPAYPFTGAITERGTGSGIGFTVNVPLPADVGDTGYAQVFSDILLPLATRFAPEIVIASAGYDAHWRNSAYVQGIRERLTVLGLAHLSQTLQSIADIWCPGRLVGILEGGYDLESLAWGVCGTIGAWMGDEAIADPIGPPPGHVRSVDISDLLAEVRAIHDLG